MSLATLLDRNKAFAATDAVAKNPKIPWLPNQLSYVINCIDSRAEPAGFLGVGLGDATVQRVVGGRVTSAVLRDVAYISYLTETKTPDGPWWELAVIHHTDCGSTLLADPELRRGFAARGGHVEAELAWLPATDPAATVRADVNTWSPRHSYPPTSWSAGTSTTPQPAPSTRSSSPPPSAHDDHPDAFQPTSGGLAAMSSAATACQTLNFIAITGAALAGSTAARRRGGILLASSAHNRRGSR
jgi:carbonic anhydrase